MSRHQIIRAWKDPEFRNRLSQAERELLPAHPAGLVELADADLDAVAGGQIAETDYFTVGSCGWRCFTTTTRAC
jgi:mersacidin/lichenicidin family type 2 lantibiotic